MDINDILKRMSENVPTDDSVNWDEYTKAHKELMRYFYYFHQFIPDETQIPDNIKESVLDMQNTLKIILNSN